MRRSTAAVTAAGTACDLAASSFVSFMAFRSRDASSFPRLTFGARWRSWVNSARARQLSSRPRDCQFLRANPRSDVRDRRQIDMLSLDRRHDSDSMVVVGEPVFRAVIHHEHKPSFHNAHDWDSRGLSHPPATWLDRRARSLCRRRRRLSLTRRGNFFSRRHNPLELGKY